MEEKEVAQKTVTINLVYDDGSEEIELPMETYAYLVYTAKTYNTTVEKVFNSLLEAAIDSEKECSDGGL
jgi:hypothetical protein